MTASTLLAPPRARATEPERTGTRPRRASNAARALAASVVLLLAYVALSFLDDPRGALGTDTGGKLATLGVMERTGSWRPEVGYWATAADPAGSLHPLYYTTRVGDRWVNVTTLPMVVAARPLYAVGGVRAVLLLPMAGAVLCAIAARRLARLVGGDDGWTVFWAVGLCTSVAVYALDFWEHTPGLACMLFGLASFVEVARGERRAGGALVAGALFGLAATMRTEALVYLGVALVVLVVVRLRRGIRMLPVAGIVGTAIGGAAVPLAVNHAVEWLALGAGLRHARVAGTAGAAAASLRHRVGEAAVTTLGLNGFRPPADVVLGATVVALVAGGALLLASGARRPVVLGGAALAVATAVVVGRFAGGLGFVPGLLVAAPLAAAGLVLAWRVRAGRFAAGVVTAAVPLVWLTQYQGGARPQWGGRYLLPTAVVLTVLALVALRGRRAALVGLLAISAAVTGCGVAWLSARTHAVADGMATLVEHAGDRAVVSTVHHLLREGGAFYDPDRHWLTATSVGELRRAFEVLAGAGDREVVVVAPAGSPLPGSVMGYTAVAERGLQVRPREPLRVVAYRDSPSP